MSNTLTINGQPYVGFEEGFTVNQANAGYYYDPDKPPCEGYFNYDEHVITFPGELTAAGTKRNCFGPALIIVPALLIVHTTKATAVANALAQLASWNQVARYTITLPNGNARADCKVSFSTRPDCIGWRRVGSGAYAAMIGGAFQKLSTA